MKITTIQKNCVFEEHINKSKFIAYSFCLQNFEQIDSILNDLKQKYPDATHICYAYKFFGLEKCFDDGEPQGTAGKPILECIKRQEISNVLVVVVRYFGGIKLGAGGLTRAYGNTAQKVLNMSEKTELFECKKIDFEVEISQNKKVSNLSNIDLKNTKISYLENIHISAFCKVEMVEKILSEIENIFSKKLQFEISENTVFV